MVLIAVRLRFPYYYKDIQILTVSSLSPGVVPECTGEVAANGDEAGKQDGRQVLARCVSRDGHVSRAHGVDSVSAAPQSAVQRDGRPAEPEFDGLSIASILRFMSVTNILSDSPFRALTGLVMLHSVLLKWTV